MVYAVSLFFTCDFIDSNTLRFVNICIRNCLFFFVIIYLFFTVTGSFFFVWRGEVNEKKSVLFANVRVHVRKYGSGTQMRICSRLAINAARPLETAQTMYNFLRFLTYIRTCLCVCIRIVFSLKKRIGLFRKHDKNKTLRKTYAIFCRIIQYTETSRVSIDPKSVVCTRFLSDTYDNIVCNIRFHGIFIRIRSIWRRRQKNERRVCVYCIAHFSARQFFSNSVSYLAPGMRVPVRR